MQVRAMVAVEPAFIFATVAGDGSGEWAGETGAEFAATSATLSGGNAEADFGRRCGVDSGD